MGEMSDTIAEVLRLDAESTPGPWDEDGIYMGLRHLCKHCSDWYYRDSDGNLIEVPRERDAALIAYYRTAAPALAREAQRLQEEIQPRIDRSIAFQEAMEEAEAERDAALAEVQRLQAEIGRLQEEVRQAQTGHECALVAAYESGLRAGQEVMRSQAAQWLEQRGDNVWARAIRDLEVSHD